MAKAKEEKMTQYLLNMKDGSQQKITIKSSWRVTFGLTAPGTKNGQYNSNLALRLYEGTSQRAVFTDVASYRDMSIQIQEKTCEVKEQVAYVETPEGKKGVNVEARIYSWRNPDDLHEPGKQFLQLPKKVTPNELLDVGSDVDMKGWESDPEDILAVREQTARQTPPRRSK